MKRIFLTSSASTVAKDLHKLIEPQGKKLVFVNTAAETEGGYKWWLSDDRKTLVEAGYAVTDYTLTGKTPEEVKETFKAFDVLFFSGGNTFYLLEKIQQSKSASIIRTFVDQGKIYIGTSAGSLVAGPDISPARGLDSVEKAPNLKGYQGIGLVDFIVFPHWGNEDFRKLYLDERLANAYTTNHKIILLTDYQFVQVEGEMYQICETRH